METVNLISSGETWKGAADKLGITQRTLRFHVERILHRVEAINMAQAVRKILIGQ